MFARVCVCVCVCVHVYVCVCVCMSADPLHRLTEGRPDQQTGRSRGEPGHLHNYALASWRGIEKPCSNLHRPFINWNTEQPRDQWGKQGMETEST